MRVLNGSARLILALLAVVVLAVCGCAVVVSESINACVLWLAGRGYVLASWLVWLSREYLKG